MSEKQTIEHHAPTPFKFGRTMDSEAIILAADNSYICHVQIHQTPRRCGDYDEPRRVANAKFIVSACNTVDSLKAKLARAEAACAEMRKALEVVNDWDDKSGPPSTDEMLAAVRQALCNANNKSIGQGFVPVVELEPVMELVRHAPNTSVLMWDDWLFKRDIVLNRLESLVKGAK